MAVNALKDKARRVLYAIKKKKTIPNQFLFGTLDGTKQQKPYTQNSAKLF